MDRAFFVAVWAGGGGVFFFCWVGGPGRSLFCLLFGPGGLICFCYLGGGVFIFSVWAECVFMFFCLGGVHDYVFAVWEVGFFFVFSAVGQGTGVHSLTGLQTAAKNTHRFHGAGGYLANPQDNITLIGLAVLLRVSFWYP